MNYQLISFDVFPDGWVKTTYQVEAPSQEIAERIIKKQLSKLFRAFPSGTLLSGAAQSLNIPGLQPNWQPNSSNTPAWVNGALGGPGVFTPTAGYVTAVGPFDNIDNSLNPWQGNVLVNHPINMVLIDPGQTIHINGEPVDGQHNTFSITNSTQNPFSLTAAGIHHQGLETQI